MQGTAQRILDANEQSVFKSSCGNVLCLCGFSFSFLRFLYVQGSTQQIVEENYVSFELVIAGIPCFINNVFVFFFMRVSGLSQHIKVENKPSFAALVMARKCKGSINFFL